MNEQVERLLEQDNFSVFLPDVFDIVEKAGEDIEQTRPIAGHCSTENLDRQEEVVVAKGLDFSEFVQFGYFNDNHKQDTAAVLGWPKTVRLEKSRWWTEGNLLVGYPPADRIWELAKSLRKSSSPRRLGFSIEGKVLQRDNGNRIVRAKVRNVAITNVPVNTDCTWDIMAKAMASIDLVDQAATKAHALNFMERTQVPADIGVDIQLHRDEYLDLDTATERVHKLRPHLTKAICRRIARLAFMR